MLTVKCHPRSSTAGVHARSTHTAKGVPIRRATQAKYGVCDKEARRVNGLSQPHMDMRKEQLKRQ